MLSDRAIGYYRQGSSCSRCIMQAASEKYRLETDNITYALDGFAGGLGIGAVCGIPLVCIMVLGMICTDETVLKAKRLEFIMRFNEKFHSLNCGDICGRVKDCEEVIRAGCNIIEEII